MLIYLANTSLYLAYTISVARHFMHDSRERYLQDVDCVLQYLKVVVGRWLLFKRGGSLTMYVYSDANNAGSMNDRR